MNFWSTLSLSVTEKTGSDDAMITEWRGDSCEYTGIEMCDSTGVNLVGSCSNIYLQTEVYCLSFALYGAVYVQL